MRELMMKTGEYFYFGHFQTQYETLKNLEVAEISSCFAITVETA